MSGPAEPTEADLAPTAFLDGDSEAVRNFVARATADAADERDRLQAEAARLADERATAIRKLKDLEVQHAQRNAELRGVRHELRMATAELATADLGAGPARPGAAPEAAPAGAGGTGPTAPPLDREALAALVEQAAAATDVLSRALAAVSSLVGAEPAGGDGGGAGGGGDVGGGEGGGGEGGGGPAVRRRRVARRRPAPLPPGILDDGAAGAEHLVRQPGALVLVDGYNVSKTQWSGLPAAEQRRRLLDACAELHARCGTDVEVVFDGAGEAPTAGALVRADVRYRFTPAGVEADDAVLARVDEEPPGRVVVVASSDRRVADGARLRGANVVGARQFLAVLRR